MHFFKVFGISIIFKTWKYIETLDLSVCHTCQFLAFQYMSMEKFDQWIKIKTMLIYESMCLQYVV